MKYLTALLLLGVLSGCGTTAKHLENRITRTLPCDRVFVTSLYGPIGITTEIDRKDVEVICKAAP